ncbi:MAG: TIGR03013 family PEP-CTERM/XrtA system glycosyltransferase [Aestuariibacter sp.]|nr:TIGR03013 family PEP-CTERM/XrtA system glycosyltransferase [Aestuariibacter sp.]
MNIQGRAADLYPRQSIRNMDVHTDWEVAGDDAGLGSKDMRLFSRLHTFRGKIRLFGHFFHAQYILLGLVEFVTFACIPYFVIPLFEAGTTQHLPTHLPMATSAFYAMILVFFLVSMGLYDTRQRTGLLRVVLPRLVVAFLMTTIILLLMITFYFDGSFDAKRLAQFIVASFIYSFVLRIYFEKVVDGNILKRRIVIVGTGNKAVNFERLRRKTDQRGFELVSYIPVVANDPIKVSPENAISLVGNICTYALENRIDEIVIALDDRRRKLPLDDLLDCRMSGINVIEMQDFFERETEKIHLDFLQPSWLIYAKGFHRNMLRTTTKRVFDVAVSSMLLLISLPVMALVALAILVESRGVGPVLYHQRRVGRGGSNFDLIKFRSMCVDAEHDGVARWAEMNDPRITRVGAFLRKYRLDELPQLWNVLAGDMSIVGPRPERPEFVEKLCNINQFYRERHRVKPGIAGWAQESYPYGASEKDSIQKLQYDLYYVKNHGILFDCYVLAQTVEVVLFGKGSR